MTLILPTDLLEAPGAPDATGALVVVRELIESAEFRSPARALPLAIGLDSNAHPVIVDLDRVQHVLVAGGPGTGKSVVLHVMLLSLLYRHAADALNLLLIDTKVLELRPYDSLPHLVHPVITGVRGALGAVRWLEAELRRRTSLLASTRVRNIWEYNARVGGGGPGLAHLVVAIDDLLEPALDSERGDAFAESLASIMAGARPCGIHVLGVTHHPSSPALERLVADAFSCRVGLWLQESDDRAVMAADEDIEWLPGVGKMVVVHPNSPRPLRVLGAFVSTEELDRVTAWFGGRSASAPFSGLDAAEIEGAIAEIDREDGIGKPPDVELDPLIRQAAEVCIQNCLGSTSLLQRRMSIGYGRAARLIHQLEMMGVLAPAHGSGPRDVLVGLEYLDGLPQPSERQASYRNRGIGCAGQIALMLVGAALLTLA